MSAETEAVKTVAGLMALAARTAPKAVGIDSVTIEIAMGPDLEKIAGKMTEIGTEKGMKFFRINANQVNACEALVLIGVSGEKTLGLNCGGCSYTTCREMTGARASEKPVITDFSGPNCIFKVTDLGIAVGSAVKTAGNHNVDNRVMYTAGVAALHLGIIKNCTIAYGIPLKASGKDIFFDVPIEH
jgi:uncharacterized ferredoxin-like protein